MAQAKRRGALAAGLLLALAALPVAASAQASTSPTTTGTEIPPLLSAPPSAPSPGWVPRGAVEVQALDKINARLATFEVKVGSSAKFGSLTVEAQACVVRGPNQAPDAAAFLVITDAHEGEPGFRGWMIASAPAVSMLEHPIYDIRVTGCRS